MTKTINEVAIMLENHIENEKERHDGFDEKLDGIIARQDYTNGTVKDLIIWRAGIVGAMAVITGLVVPLLIYIYNK